VKVLNLSLLFVPPTERRRNGDYYVATVGNITEDAIKKYIQEQSEESRKEESDGAAL